MTPALKRYQQARKSVPVRKDTLALIKGLLPVVPADAQIVEQALRRFIKEVEEARTQAEPA